MGKSIEEGFKAGWLLATKVVCRHWAHVSGGHGKLAVTDGPF